MQVLLSEFGVWRRGQPLAPRTAHRVWMRGSQRYGLWEHRVVLRGSEKRTKTCLGNLERLSYLPCLSTTPSCALCQG